MNYVKVAAAAAALFLLAGCGASDTEDKARTYKDYPIDCVESGVAHSRVMSCDFVQWHLDHDPDFHPFPTPTPTS